MKAFFEFSALLCLVASGNAAAMNQPVRSMLIDANFTDRAVSPLPELNAVNVYRGLFYNAWDLVNLASPLSGSMPHTEPNAIATTLVTAQATRGTPTLTVDFPGSTSLFFDLLSFYFGCIIPAGQGVAQLAQQCSILVAGFDAFNKQRAVATFTFDPPVTNLANPPMIQAVLPSSFVGLHNVTLVQAIPATQLLVVDDPVYRLYTSS